VIVREFNVVGVSIHPAETYAPRVVNSDAILANPIISEFLESIAGRNSEIAKFLTRINLYELSPGSLLQLN
jgi:hypothetical protein